MLESQGLNQGILYVVATPIGNLKDITLRALELLKKVDLIACEDTRVTGRILHYYQIKTPMVSFHQHSGQEKIDRIITDLKSGKDVALVTDSGTPGISDPGAKLIKNIYEYDKIKIVSVPGPSALTAAISISGVPSKNILFIGFLPHKKGRKKSIEQIREYWQKGLTIIFYESPYRIIKTLLELASVLDNAEIACFREITKKFEEIIKIDLSKKENIIKKVKPKGEFTVIIYPKEKK